MLLAEIKDFNVLIYNKTFFYQPVKNKYDGMVTITQESY